MHAHLYTRVSLRLSPLLSRHRHPVLCSPTRSSSSLPLAEPSRALEHPSPSRARGPCVAIYIKRWSVASRSAETRERFRGASGGAQGQRRPFSFPRDGQRRKSSENTRIRNAASQYARAPAATKKISRSPGFDRDPSCTSAASRTVAAPRSRTPRVRGEFFTFRKLLHGSQNVTPVLVHLFPVFVNLVALSITVIC